MIKFGSGCSQSISSCWKSLLEAPLNWHSKLCGEGLPANWVIVLSELILKLDICLCSCQVHTLTHWDWVMHICVSKLTIIGSDNGLSPGWRQAIIWTNAEFLVFPGLWIVELYPYIYRQSTDQIELRFGAWTHYGIPKPDGLYQDWLNFANTAESQLICPHSDYNLLPVSQYIFCFRNPVIEFGSGCSQ